MTMIGTLIVVAALSAGIDATQMGSIGFAVILGLILGTSIGMMIRLILALRAASQGQKPPMRQPSGTYDPWLDEFD
jgi:hypothetical protein